jgi:hypothetical protein
MDRNRGAYFGEPLPEAPWPVASKGLLTNRERALYQSLHTLYPEHRIFVQVALSQLIDVPKDQPDRFSIRARFSQLVADFVLCRPDLSVLMVIELDDRSHERRDRKAADVRKAKALTDAGLRLVRIPAGPLPSPQSLRDIVDENCAPSRSDSTVIHPLTPAVAVLRSAAGWESAPAESPTVHHELLTSRALHATVLRLILGTVLLGIGWFLYAQVLPHAIQNSFQHLTPKLPPVSTIVNRITPQVTPPARVFSPPVTVGPTPQELELKRRAQLVADAELKRQKDSAWAAAYAAPVSCEHPVDWNAEVECGNQYMRAKKAFETHWLKDHYPGDSVASAVALDNHSTYVPGR